MRYHALATDYDGTITLHGRVDDDTLAALERLRASRRKLILVTGRQLDDLATVFDRFELFDRIVAENGALLYCPATREERVLGEAPPPQFAERLREAGVPVATGRVIVATWEPHETTVLEAIRDIGLEHQIIFNKGAVMVLPPGVNKSSGLQAALHELGLSAHNAVAVGDAENDLALMNACEFAVAVANALPSVKEQVDWTTQRDHGAGVAELIDRLLADDLRDFPSQRARRSLTLGVREDGGDDCVSPYSTNILLAGTSGSGKSTFATGFMERLAEQAYQFVCIDPEGDYSELPGAIVLGTPMQEPVLGEVANVLQAPDRNCVVNLLAVPFHDRPGVFSKLFGDLLALRATTGRPHWIIVDETHHLWPTEWEEARFLVPNELHGMMFITVHPDHVAPVVNKLVNVVVAMGDEPQERLAEFARAVGCEVPARGAVPDKKEALVWRVGEAAPYKLQPLRSTTERRRHVRKYAEGDLGEDRSFYFKGPHGALNLRAHNLLIFIQLAEGVDDETWEFHLRRQHYSGWFRAAIKDEELAKEAQSVENDRACDAKQSRARIIELIQARYTLPA